MATAKKLPSGQWRTLVYSHTDMNGKRHYESFTAGTKKESEYLAAEFSLNKKRYTNTNNITIADAVKKYIESKESVLSPSTIRGYKAIERCHIVKIKDIKLKDINNTDIQLWISELSKELTPKTVKNTFGLLSAALDMFYPELILKVRLPQKQKPELYVPSDEDVKKLIEHVKGRELELAIYLAAFGPMRRGEICALEGSDIDRENNIITVSKSMVLAPDNTWVIKAPKTYSGYRQIIFPDFVIRKLPPKQSGRLLSATPSQITNRFRDAVKYSGLPHFRFHDLRHYAASIMHAIGIPDQYIIQRGGWSSDFVMKSIYRNTIDDQTKKFNTNILSHFENFNGDED